MNIDALRARLQEGRDNGMAVRALVFINPGNPTGQCLSYQNLKDLIQFAAEENLVLLADEVYQTNIYQVKHASAKSAVHLCRNNCICSCQSKHFQHDTSIAGAGLQSISDLTGQQKPLLHTLHLGKTSRCFPQHVAAQRDTGLDEQF